jgi:hypothetical protein
VLVIGEFLLVRVVAGNNTSVVSIFDNFVSIFIENNC